MLSMTTSISLVIVVVMLVMFAVLLSVLPIPVMALLIIIPMRLIMRDIHIVVPIIFNEIDLPAAGVVFLAVLAPFFLVSGGYMEIERLLYDVDGRRADHDGFGVNHLGSRRVADINLSVKSRLADANGHIDIRGCCLS